LLSFKSDFLSFLIVTMSRYYGVSHSNLTKQAILAHTIAQFVDKHYGVSFFGPRCRMFGQ